MMPSCGLPYQLSCFQVSTSDPENRRADIVEGMVGRFASHPFWYPDIKPGETVEMLNTQDTSASLLSLMRKDEGYAQVVIRTAGDYITEMTNERTGK